MPNWFQRTFHHFASQISFGEDPYAGLSIEDPTVQAFLDDLFTRFPYRTEMIQWFQREIQFVLRDPSSTAGGGFWIPDQRKVFLFTAQYEAAIHEIAHSWWHDRRIGYEQDMIDATIALSQETDPRYSRMQGLAYGYIHGIPEQHWAGMLVERNDWEMYAGLASGMMADLRLLPSYMHYLYDTMYYLLPADDPWPVSVAPHG